MSALGASQRELSRTEAELVVAVRKGDDRAFGELYERYGRRIFAYVLGLVRDHNRAEDITQDVFLSALRRTRSSDQAISFKPWIYEIAKNACIDEFRRVARAREVPIEDGSGEHLVAAEPSPDTWFERGQQLATLNGAFRGLSERQHKVMVLRELEGLSYTEIAARAGMTVPMVQSTLLRARRRLSEEYNDIASGRRCQQIHAVIDSGGQAAVDGLGLRDRRRFARHVAHCQPCALYVHMAGVSAPETGMPAVVKKIAGLLPFPFTRLSFPWGGQGRSGSSHGSGILRSARRAAQAVHPATSLGVGPATVATIAVVVIAGGGAAVGLLSPGHAQGARGTPAVVSARPTADTRARTAAPARGVSRQGGQAASVKGSSSHPARAARPGAARTTAAHKGAGASGPSAQRAANSAGSGGGSTQSSAPGTHGSGSPPPAPPVHLPHLPSLPSLPRLPVGTHVPPTITRPLKKVVKKVLHPPLPGPLGQAVKSPLGQAVKEVGIP